MCTHYYGKGCLPIKEGRVGSLAILHQAWLSSGSFWLCSYCLQRRLQRMETAMPTEWKSEWQTAIVSPTLNSECHSVGLTIHIHIHSFQRSRRDVSHLSWIFESTICIHTSLKALYVCVYPARFLCIDWLKCWIHPLFVQTQQWQRQCWMLWVLYCVRR